jgi:hypothetical protein
MEAVNAGGGSPLETLRKCTRGADLMHRDDGHTPNQGFNLCRYCASGQTA